MDDPHMLNVAVSRAVNSLAIVVSGKKENRKTNFGDLEKYIEYNNLEMIESKVFSVFDLLYKGFYEERKKYLKNHKRISEYDSENLANSVLEEVLRIEEFSQIDYVVHSSLSTLVKNREQLSEEERRYAMNPLTHLDFLLFSKMDKVPLLAIEIDGTSFHSVGSRQAERDRLKNSVLQKCGILLLRIRTDESRVSERIAEAIRKAL